MSVTPVRPKAYSYLRFSTPEQEKGDSFRRQSQSAIDYAVLRDLDLDEQLTFHDRGVSGFRGANAATGKLREFIRAVEDGLIAEGSFLLVENLDRISRQDPWDAMPLFQSIINLGVTIVTLQDEKEWSKEKLRENPYRLMESIMVMIRANEESTLKARRLKSAWVNKRATAGTKKLTKSAPSWLILNQDRTEFTIIPEKANVVKRIFEMTLKGMGQNAIAKCLNEEKIKPFGRGQYWRRSNISKLQDYEGVVGTFQPHTIEHDGQRKRRKPEAKIEGYFPAIISKELWADAAAVKQGCSPKRGRHSAITNILGGVGTCPLCGGTVTKTSKGNGWSYLVCAGAKVGTGCKYTTVRYDEVEQAILQRLPERLQEPPVSKRGEGVDAEIENCEMQIVDAKEDLKALVKQIRLGTSVTLSSEIRAAETDLERLEAKLVQLRNTRETLSNSLINMRAKRLCESIEQTKSLEEINIGIRGLFDKVIVNYIDGVLEFNWKQGGTATFPFAMPKSVYKSRSNSFPHVK
jgi:DNA invertase Pin-like site-specific DNA recombinase